MNRNVPGPRNPVIVVTGTGKRSGNRIRENRHGNDERKEQGHGAGTWHRCRGDIKGVLLRIGMAAAMSTAVLGFLSYHVLPRLRKTDYIKMVSDADAQTALTLAPLVLLAICCLCVYPLIGHGKRSRAGAAGVRNDLDHRERTFDRPDTTASMERGKTQWRVIAVSERMNGGTGQCRSDADTGLPADPAGRIGFRGRLGW